MTPTVADGSFVLIHKRADIQRYDLVAFHQEEEQLIKRVIGVPGDSFLRSGNRLLIFNDQVSFDESKMYTLSNEEVKEWALSGTLSADEYFLVGDALSNSRDSRSFGFVSKDSFLGEVHTFGK